LRAKYFHEALTGNVHEYSLKLSIGKASAYSQEVPWPGRRKR
jgi:hypothetical protein